MVSNDLGNRQALYSTGKNFLSVDFYSSTAFTIYLREYDATAGHTTDSYVGSLATVYYLKIKRDEAVGTYGTLYCYIYSDSARTTLLDTLTVTLHTSKKDFQYIYGFNNSADASTNISGYSENLDLTGGVITATEPEMEVYIIE
jgi:hypothetical protein